MQSIDNQKINELVRVYTEHVSNVTLKYHVEKEEGYKFVAVNNFQKYFNLGDLNLVTMLDRAILNNNLVQGSMYFPKRMLLRYAEIFPTETKNILENLFDENRSVYERIDETENSFKVLNEKRNVYDTSTGNSFITLRFISLLIGFKYPEKYNALKPSEWRFICSYLDEDFSIANRTTSGEKYKIYEQYIEAIRNNVKNNQEIFSTKEALTKGLEFSDTEFRWMTQDVIYISARIISGKKSEDDEVVNNNLQNSGAVSSEESLEVLEENTGFMPLEKHLEEYILKNWKLVDFGEKLEVFLDEDGAPAQQFPTDQGIIDILAKDSEGNFVVIELKRDNENYKVVGQILNYMGWVRKHLTTNGEGVRGIIIVGKADETLKNAVSEVSNRVLLKEYKIKLSLDQVKFSE